MTTTTTTTTTTTATATHRLKGVNSDEHTCTACGRTDLVRVAWLAPLDTDGNEIAAPSAYGTDCAGRILHGTKTSANTARVAHEGYVLAKVGRWLARGESFAAIASECRLRRVNAEETPTGVRLLVSGEWVEVTE